MKPIPVVISDESVINTYGGRVLTGGIDLSHFELNPILLYAHQRPGYGDPKILPIGKVTNLKKTAGKLLGDLEFDEDDEFAVKVYKKFKKGILNAVSPRLKPVEFTDNPEKWLKGQTSPTAAQTILKEVSVADIPGVHTAVKLSYEGVETLSDMRLCSDDKDLTQEDIKLMAVSLSATEPTQKPNNTNMNFQSITLAMNGYKGTDIVLSAKPDESELAKVFGQLIEKANKAADLKLSLDASEKAKGLLETELTKLKEDQKTEAANALAESVIELMDKAEKVEKKITAAERKNFEALILVDSPEQAKKQLETVKLIIDGRKGHGDVTTQLGSGETIQLTDADKSSFSGKMYARMAKLREERGGK